MARRCIISDEDFTVADRVQEVAKAAWRHPARRSRWPGCSTSRYITAPIIGASRLEHLDQSIAALEIKLSEEEIKRLEELYQLHPVLGHHEQSQVPRTWLCRSFTLLLHSA